MTLLRAGCVIATSLLACACTSSYVLVQTPRAGIPTIDKALAAVARQEGLRLMYARQSYSPGVYRRNRPFAKALAPDEDGAPTKLVYTVEVDDLEGHVILWMADAHRAAPLCRALRAARVPIEVKRGADQAPECFQED